MGGPGHPPEKPYQVTTLDKDDAVATAQLQAARDAGFELLFAIPFGDGFFTETRVILGNYKDKN